MMHRSQQGLMGPDDEETIRTPVDGLVCTDVQEIRAVLEALPDSPRCRELRGRVETYERALEAQKHVELRQAQRWALLELIVELRQRTEELSESSQVRLRDEGVGTSPGVASGACAVGWR